MPSLSSAQRTLLQAQHTLQGDDLTAICTLASIEGADLDSLWQSIVSWDFEQLLGFTLHLFITAESSEVRTKIAQLLHKFGSKIVRPLIQISLHFQSHAHLGNQLGSRGHKASEISMLAQQSTQQINPQALSVGFSDMLSGDDTAVLLPVVVNYLTLLPVREYQTVLSNLAQQLASADYQALERQILYSCSDSQAQERFEPMLEPETMAETNDALTPQHVAPARREAHLVG